MPESPDPYELLGVPRDASAKQIRLAYRKAVLACHPDNHFDDPADAAAAAERFRRLTEAYRTVRQGSRWVIYIGGGPDSSRKTRTAGEFAFGQAAWPFAPVKFTSPTRNENALFVGFWLLALAASVGAAWLILQSGWVVIRDEAPMTTAGAAAVLLTSVAIYGGILAGALALLVTTRRIVWLMTRPFRRALPGGAGKPLPPTGPRLPNAPDSRP